jgi:hypothetical protein
MKKVSKGVTLSELEDLLKLANGEIGEWCRFRERLKERINRLEVKHANKKRKV